MKKSHEQITDITNTLKIYSIIFTADKKQSQQLPHNEIAEKLGTSVDNVKQAIFAAGSSKRRMLKE